LLNPQSVATSSERLQTIKTRHILITILNTFSSIAPVELAIIADPSREVRKVRCLAASAVPRGLCAYCHAVVTQAADARSYELSRADTRPYPTTSSKLRKFLMHRPLLLQLLNGTCPADTTRQNNGVRSCQLPPQLHQSPTAITTGV